MSPKNVGGGHRIGVVKGGTAERPRLGTRSTWRCESVDDFGHRCKLVSGHRGQHEAFGRRFPRPKGKRT